MPRSARLVLAMLAACGDPVAVAPTQAPEGMVLVEGGDYTIGGGVAGEAPVRTVTLQPFYIDRYPVTEEQLLAFHAASGPSDRFKGRRMGTTAEADRFLPAVDITYDESAAYASSLGRRLPTEAEWEAAARGLDARPYPWGADWDTARFAASAPGPNPIGRHPGGASQSGVEDLVGNVFHWTTTRVAGVGGDVPERDQPVLYVVKGGSLGRIEHYTRGSFRTALKPDLRSAYLGFRTVLPLDKPDTNLAAGARGGTFDHQRFEASEALRQLLSFELQPGRTMAPLMERQVARDGAGKVVADLGVGIGYLTVRLSERAGPDGRVYAVDIDQSVLDFVTAWAAQDGLTNVETVLSARTDTRLPPDSLDELWLLGTLHCLDAETWRPFIESCRDALKPGGKET